MLDRVTAWWCRLWHGEPMWPHHGRYECRICQRRIALEWDVVSEKTALRQPKVSGIGERPRAVSGA
jgi:hypothetical protein